MLGILRGSNQDDQDERFRNIDILTNSPQGRAFFDLTWSGSTADDFRDRCGRLQDRPWRVDGEEDNHCLEVRDSGSRSRGKRIWWIGGPDKVASSAPLLARHITPALSLRKHEPIPPRFQGPGSRMQDPGCKMGERGEAARLCSQAHPTGIIADTE